MDDAPIADLLRRMVDNVVTQYLSTGRGSEQIRQNVNQQVRENRTSQNESEMRTINNQAQSTCPPVSTDAHHSGMQTPVSYYQPSTSSFTSGRGRGRMIVALPKAVGPTTVRKVFKVDKSFQFDRKVILLTNEYRCTALTPTEESSYRKKKSPKLLIYDVVKFNKAMSRSELDGKMFRIFSYYLNAEMTLSYLRISTGNKLEEITLEPGLELNGEIINNKCKQVVYVRPSVSLPEADDDSDYDCDDDSPPLKRRNFSNLIIGALPDEVPISGTLRLPVSISAQPEFSSPVVNERTSALQDEGSSFLSSSSSAPTSAQPQFHSPAVNGRASAPRNEGPALLFSSSFASTSAQPELHSSVVNERTSTLQDEGPSFLSSSPSAPTSAQPQFHSPAVNGRASAPRNEEPALLFSSSFASTSAQPELHSSVVNERTSTLQDEGPSFLPSSPPTSNRFRSELLPQETNQTVPEFPARSHDFTAPAIELKQELDRIYSMIDRVEEIDISVSRRSILECAHNSLAGEIDFYKKLYVEFLDATVQNDTGAPASEMGRDAGGLTREFLSLSLESMRNTAMFSGPDYDKYIIFNEYYFEQNYYYTCGVLIALSLVHGSGGPKFFSRYCFQYLVEGVTMVEPNEDVILHGTVLQALSDIKEATDLEELMVAVQKHSEVLEVAYPDENIETFDSKDVIYDAVLKYYTQTVREPAYSQFLDGLRVYGVSSLMQEHPIWFDNVFIRSPMNTLTTRSFRSLFFEVREVEGSNRYHTETNVLYLWRLFVKKVKRGDCNLTLEDLLRYATGVSSVPPRGFPQRPRIQFLHHRPDKIFPEASTCDFLLELPVKLTKIEDFCTFQTNVEEGILTGLRRFGVA